MNDARLDSIRSEMMSLADQYAEIAYAPKPFVAGETRVPVSGKVVGAPELRNLIDSSLELWLTTGRFNDLFEERLRKYLGRRFALTVNSGSSANLTATSALCSPMLRGEELKPGDEVITCATGFPTTVNPSIQNGLVPVFVDVDLPTYNIRADLIEAAVTEKTRAIIVAHTLGIPFDLGEVMRVARKYDLWVIEDCCDALGSTYDDKLVGTFGDVGTLSFYPAHHITMGEGGAVFTHDGKIKRLLESVRDWGRDCYCAPGQDNTCQKRFGWKLGDLPQGYDHKYTYSNLGYNLKISDMQAAVGLAQLDRLDKFIEDRRHNARFLTEALTDLEEHILLPQATPRSNPSWFGYPLTVRSEADGVRDDLTKFLNSERVDTRLLFGGNLIRQPYMNGRRYRVHGELPNSDKVMNATFWIGLYPGLTESHLSHAVDRIRKFFTR